MVYRNLQENGNPIVIKDEGVLQTKRVKTLDFIGDTVDATHLGADVDVTVDESKTSKVLLLDQTTPQTIYNGLPLLEATRTIDADNQIVDKKYVDDAVEVENLWDRTGTVLSPHTAGDDITTTGDITANNLSNTNTGDQDLSGLVPYTGATADVDLGAYGLTTANAIIDRDVVSGDSWLSLKDDGVEKAAFRKYSTSSLEIYAQANLYFNIVGATPYVVYKSAGANGINFQLEGGVAQTNKFRSYQGILDFQTVGIYDMLFSTNSVERMRIDSDGNVGIGTDIPDAKLEVVGNVLATELISANSGTINRTSGVITSVAITDGRTLTPTRTSGAITSITDGTRTWTFNYTDDLISSWTLS